MKDMKTANRVRSTAHYYLLLLIFFTPLMFLPPMGSDFLRSSFLNFSAFLLLLLFGIYSFLAKSFRVSWNNFFYLILANLSLLLISSFFSIDKRLSFEQLSLFLSLSLIIFLAGNLTQKLAEVKRMAVSFVSSSFVISIVSLCYALELINFSFFDNPTNQAFLVSLGFLTALGLLNSLSRLSIKIPLIFVLIIFSLALSVLSSLGQLVILVLALSLFLIFSQKLEEKQAAKIVVVLSIMTLLVIFSARLFNLLPTEKFSENRLPLKYSAQVSLSTVMKYPILGSGAGTFFEDFKQFKPREITQSSLWNTRTTEASSAFFDSLATLGILGTLSFLILLTLPAFTVLNYLNKVSPNKNNSITIAFLSSLVLGMLSYFVINLKTLGIAAVFFTFLFSFSLLKSLGVISFKEFALSAKFLTFCTLAISVLIFLLSSFLNLKNTLAEYYFRESFVQNKTPEQMYDLQLSAIRVNPKKDTYHRQFSLTNMALALSTMSGKDTPSDEKLRISRILIDQSINEGKVAQNLSPNNSSNTEVLGQVYLALAGSIKGASEASINSFKRAIALDPYNLSLYLSLAQALETNGQFEEAANQLKIASNYLPAEREEFKNIQKEIERLTKDLKK